MIEGYHVGAQHSIRCVNVSHPYLNEDLVGSMAPSDYVASFGKRITPWLKSTGLDIGFMRGSMK